MCDAKSPIANISQVTKVVVSGPPGPPGKSFFIVRDKFSLHHFKIIQLHLWPNFKK